MEAPRALRLLLALMLVGLLLFPLVGERFYIQYATKIMIMAIFAMSLDLLVGYTGLVSLGHALFYGIAGYALAMVGGDAAVSLWWSLPGAMLVSALAALVVGVLVLRTSRDLFHHGHARLRADDVFLRPRFGVLRRLGRHLPQRQAYDVAVRLGPARPRQPAAPLLPDARAGGGDLPRCCARCCARRSAAC